MAETNPPPSLGKAFGQATKSQAQTPKLSDSIKRDAPKLTHEMPGPFGAAVRKVEAYKQLSKDYATSNAARAKNLTDKSKSNLMISKENVQNRQGGQLTKEFDAAKSRGKEV